MRGVVGTEVVKQGRRLRTYVAYTILAAIPVIMTLVIDTNPPSPRDGPFLAFLGTESGLLIAAFALRVTSEFLLVVVVALFAGDAIAGEASWGNLRYLLVRPIGRGRLFVGKFTVSIVYAWLAVAFVVVVGAVIGGAVFGFSSISIFFRPELSQSVLELLAHLALATLYVAWFLTTVAAFSFMLGCLTDAPSGAILGGIGFWITCLILDGIDSLGQVRYFLPTHWSGAWAQMFLDNRVSDDMIRGALLTLGYVVVFIGFAWWWFRRKDILS